MGTITPTGFIKKQNGTSLVKFKHTSSTWPELEKLLCGNNYYFIEVSYSFAMVGSKI